MNATIYYAPDALGSPANYFFDGVHMYQRVQGLGSLGALHGWLKRIGRKVGKGLKKVAKGVVKIHKKAFKAVVKVTKVVTRAAIKIIAKALPIVNAALTFFPGIGWVAKAVLTVAEMGFKAGDKAIDKAVKKAKAKRNLRNQMKAMNSKKTTLAKPATAVKPVSQVKQVQQVSEHQVTADEPIPKIRLTPTPPVYTVGDFMKINEAVNKNQATPDQVAMLVNQFHRDRLQTIMNF